MPEYDNRNTGVIFRNDNKQSDRHPDYKGHFTDANNVEHWFDGWIRQSAKGPLISFRVKPKDQSGSGGGNNAGEESQDDPF